MIPRRPHTATHRRAARTLLALAAVVALEVRDAESARDAHAGGLADEAELQFQVGADLYQRGDYRESLEHFFVSNRLVPNRNVVFNIARAFEQLHRYADAHRYYSEVLLDEDRPQKIQNIQAAIARIAPYIAQLKVDTDPPGATIYIDRKDLGSRGTSPHPLALAEGRYRVIAELSGYESAFRDHVEVKTGATTTVTLKLVRIVGIVDVAVHGAPAATVHVDDEHAPPVCTAPCTFAVPPGRHMLYFAGEGLRASPREVNVVADQSVKVTAELAPLTGSLMVSADERGAVVEVDGKPMGFSPVVIQNVAIGRRRVRVSLHGYGTVEREVDVKTGEQTELTDLELNPIHQVAAASRYLEQIDDAPSSVTVIDRQELRAFGYPTIAESLRGVRGVYLSNDRAYFSAGIRGLGEPNDYGNRVLVLQDGASLNDNILSSSYIGSDARTDLHDIDRIEVVRGPGSLLYGTGAFSGVINLVPRGRDEPTSAHVEAGTYDNAAEHARGGFHYNFSPTMGAWASISAARSDGVDVPITLANPGRGAPVEVAHGADYFRSFSSAGRFWADALTVQWFVSSRDQRIPVGVYQTVINDDRTHYSDTRYLAEVRYEPKLTDNLQLFVRAHADHYAFAGGYATGSTALDLDTEQYTGTWFGGEARVLYSPMSMLRFTLGGEGQADPEASMYGSTPRQPPYLNVQNPYGFGAGYLIGEATPVPWLRINAGARVDAYSTFGAVVVPRGALIFKTPEGGVLKVMGGRAFRAPSIYEQFYTDGVTQAPGVQPARGITLGPESIWQGEVEYSHRFLQNWVGLVAGNAAYVSEMINTIADTPTSSLIRYANSTVPALTAGVDIEVRREWRSGWMLTGMYGYQYAHYLDADNGRLANAPEHLASLKGVVPVITDVLTFATRITLEAPRRINMESDATTETAVIGDLTMSGNLRAYGVSYVFGIYNVGDIRYSYPVANTYLSTTMPQNGRTFLADIKVTYP